MGTPKEARTSACSTSVSERERHLDCDHDWDRLSVERAGFETPLLYGVDSRVIEIAMQAPDNTEVSDSTIRFHDGLHRDCALHSLAHGLGRVLRLGVTSDLRQLNAGIARTSDIRREEWETGAIWQHGHRARIDERDPVDRILTLDPAHTNCWRCCSSGNGPNFPRCSDGMLNSNRACQSLVANWIELPSFCEQPASITCPQTIAVSPTCSLATVVFILGRPCPSTLTRSHTKCHVATAVRQAAVLPMAFMMPSVQPYGGLVL